MKSISKQKVAKVLNSNGVSGMSVCSSCASCGCGGSRCVSTCKGCHDKDVKIETVHEIYSRR